MGFLSDLADAIPEEFGHCWVYTIPKLAWKEKFKPVRRYLDGVYGENYILHNEEPCEKSQFVIKLLAKAFFEGRDTNMKLYKEISDEVAIVFRSEGSTRDIEYSERAVINVLKRYPDRIEKERKRIQSVNRACDRLRV